MLMTYWSPLTVKRVPSTLLRMSEQYVGDTLGFKTNTKDNPLTRKGILSTIKSIYDLHGFGAHFLLKGKQDNSDT